MNRAYCAVDIDGGLTPAIEWAAEYIPEQPAGEERRYYASKGPWRVLVVMRHGLTITDLSNASMSQGLYADAVYSWEVGKKLFVPQPGKVYLKISVASVNVQSGEAALRYAQRHGLEIESLAAVIARAPRSDLRGGYRGTGGRKREGDTVRVRLPQSLIDKATDFGGGDFSYGVAEALRLLPNRGDVE